MMLLDASLCWTTPGCGGSKQQMRLDCGDAGLACSDPDSLFNIRDEDFSVTDPPGLGGATDRLDGFFDHVVAEHNLDLHLREKIDNIFSATIELGVALLAPEALGLGHCNSLKTYFL